MSKLHLYINGNRSRDQYIGKNLRAVFLCKFIAPDIDSDLTLFKTDIELNINIIASHLRIQADVLWSEWVTFHDAVCYWLPKYEEELIAV
jgi:hypothetical protein